VTLLEASAGTGKTFAIAALATRLVAEGHPLSQLLLVTFTRMATGELRERVRERLVGAEQALASGSVPPDDAVLQLLASGAADERTERQRRLAEAVAGFDAATIATTHGFCQHVLASLGVAGDVERDVTFVEDLSDLVDEAVDDLYVRRFVRDAGQPPIIRADALRIGRDVVGNPQARIEPILPPQDDGEVWQMRVRLAHAVRDEVERRKRRLAVMTYDDLLTRLQETLAHPDTGAEARAKLRERYRFVLVDEFQDTDPIQWDILQRAFGDGGTTLVLIGDPKQAIYAFRGADVFAYLAAASSATTTATMGINWRSDQDLIDAFDRLFAGAQLGDEGIVYREVRAADGNQAPRLAGAPVTTPLRIRLLHRSDGLAPVGRGGLVPLDAARDLVALDLADDVVRLLESPATVEGERVRPRHVAVLVATNSMAQTVRGALDQAGVPAVINGAGSVLATAAATQWLRLLEALERPESEPRGRAAALTPFVGWSAERVATAGGEAWEDVHTRLHRWAGILRQHGVAALFDRISASEELPRRVLSLADGERELTDLRHVAQLLHQAAIEQELGVASLAGWIRQRRADAARDAGHEERSRRLDSDAEAVQVLTIHRSKGLEFPIVYVPSAWDATWIDDDAPPVYHDRERGDGVRSIDVGVDGPDSGYHKLLAKEEERGEDLRLLYVSLTRAKHQVVVWWVAGARTGNSPLARLLFAKRADGFVRPNGGPLPADARVEERLGELGLPVERVSAPQGLVWSGEAPSLPDLAAARFERTIDLRWTRTSYTGLTAAQYEAAQVASEPEEEVLADEEIEMPAGPASAADEELALRDVPLPLAAIPGGTAVGDLVHRILEATDFAAPDLAAELAARLAEQRSRRDVELGEGGSVLVDGLAAALATPLGQVAGDQRLCDAGRADRLDELVFELPLVGGDAPTGAVSTLHVADVLERHLPAGDPLAAYPERLRDPSLRRDLRGYLTGVLDLVLRVGAPGGAARYLLVDYKTNWLGTDGEDLSAWHYRPSALAEAMMHAHYPLQALLYLIALHRYLRWRLPGYAADRNLGGVRYLFLRGMIGPSTPVVPQGRCGVFAWNPPAALVAALSDLLDRGKATR
jgi:exodeoxyribonuclease V beta subunit